jgi:hypothetical protein
MGQWRYRSSYSSSQHVIYTARRNQGKKEERKEDGRNVATVKLLQKKENNWKKTGR